MRSRPCWRRTASSMTRPTLPKKTGPFGPGCYHFATIWLSEGRVHNLGRPIVSTVDEMAVDIERDRWAGVPEAAGYGKDVNAGRDQHARVGMAQAVEGDAGQCAFPHLGHGVGRQRLAFEVGQHRTIVRGASQPEGEPLLRLGRPVTA